MEEATARQAVGFTVTLSRGLTLADLTEGRGAVGAAARFSLFLSLLRNRAGRRAQEEGGGAAASAACDLPVLEQVLLAHAWAAATRAPVLFNTSSPANAPSQFLNGTDALMACLNGDASAGDGEPGTLALSQPGAGVAAPAASGGVAMTFNILLPSSGAQGAAIQEALRAPSAPSLILSGLVEALATATNRSADSFNATLSDIGPVTLTYRRSRWAFMWAWLTANLSRVLGGAGALVAVAITLGCTRRCTARLGKRGRRIEAEERKRAAWEALEARVGAWRAAKGGARPDSRPATDQDGVEDGLFAGGSLASNPMVPAHSKDSAGEAGGEEGGGALGGFARRHSPRVLSPGTLARPKAFVASPRQALLRPSADADDALLDASEAPEAEAIEALSNAAAAAGTATRSKQGAMAAKGRRPGTVLVGAAAARSASVNSTPLPPARGAAAGRGARGGRGPGLRAAGGAQVHPLPPSESASP